LLAQKRKVLRTFPKPIGFTFRTLYRIRLCSAKLRRHPPPPEAFGFSGWGIITSTAFAFIKMVPGTLTE